MIVRPTIVVNVRTALDVVEAAKREGRFVDIMRPSKWGNPFVVLNALGRYKREFTDDRWLCNSREDAVRKHAEWLHGQPALIEAIPELVDKVLGCCCMPKRCHGEELVRLANALRFNVFAPGIT